MAGIKKADLIALEGKNKTLTVIVIVLTVLLITGVFASIFIVANIMIYIGNNKYQTI